MFGGKHEDLERDKRQLMEPGGHPVNMEILPVFVSHRLYILQSKEEGKTRGILTKIQRTE